MKSPLTGREMRDSMRAGPIEIFHLITSLDVGGTETMLHRLLSFMDKRKFRNRVVCLTGIGLVGREMQRSGIPVYALNMPTGRVRTAALATLWNLLRRNRPDILQTWLYHSDLLGLILGKAAGVRHLCWNIRCSYMDLDRYHATTRWTLRLCSLLSNFPDRILTNSVEARSFHVKLGYRSSGWNVIPNGFDLDRFRPDPAARAFLLRELGLEREPDPFLIGFMARYDPMKDHATFIEAASRLLERGRDVHLVLAGTGVDPRNEALVRRIPARWERRFHLCGRRDDIERVTAGLDVASLASHGEGFPNVVCEAMSCGVPCVVVDVGDSARIVGDPRLVVPPRHPEALANALESVMNMPHETRKELGRAARHRIQTRFDIRRIADAYEMLYAGIVSRAPLPPEAGDGEWPVPYC